MTMARFATVADRDAIQTEMPYGERDLPVTLYQILTQTKTLHSARNAISFQLLSDPKSKAETLTWSDLLGRVTQAANLFRSLGVGEKDVVAYLLPNSTETAVVLLAGAVAGIVNPINPLLDASQIAAILRETKASVLVTLKPFPHTDLAQKAAAALELAPGVHTVLEVDLNRHLSPPKSWIVPLIRPKNPARHKARILPFGAACAHQPADHLTFADSTGDRVAAFFHTGGTTGMPKVAQHKYSGMIYNGWLGGTLLFDEGRRDDLPLAPVSRLCRLSHADVLHRCRARTWFMPTPQGYRGEGVFDNFWKLIERWQVTFLITVPTAIAALMQRPVNADVSSLKTAISGSAPLPIELYNRFKAATGVEIAEGYGLTEATCLVSPATRSTGRKRSARSACPCPIRHVRILHSDSAGTVTRNAHR
jgi:acyl-coenzyme A synthetase/AMP-(fatty) acid ligase